MKILKIIDVIILILTTGAFGFGAWGLYTDAGHKEFHELAYIIPDLSMQLGLILFVVHIILLIITCFFKKKK